MGSRGRKLWLLTADANSGEPSCCCIKLTPLPHLSRTLPEGITNWLAVARLDAGCLAEQHENILAA
jgi:hypothetical protein